MINWQDINENEKIVEKVKKYRYMEAKKSILNFNIVYWGVVVFFVALAVAMGDSADSELNYIGIAIVMTLLFVIILLIEKISLSLSKKSISNYKYTYGTCIYKESNKHYGRSLIPSTYIVKVKYQDSNIVSPEIYVSSDMMDKIKYNSKVLVLVEDYRFYKAYPLN